MLRFAIPTRRNRRTGSGIETVRTEQAAGQISVSDDSGVREIDRSQETVVATPAWMQDSGGRAGMIKREELTNPASCMSRARDDEMTFVLLGRDAAAPVAIRAWVAERTRLGKNKATDEQILEALRCAAAMDQQTPRPEILPGSSEEMLTAALQTLSGCLPDRVFVYGAYGEKWSTSEPDWTDEYETVDFKALLGEPEIAASTRTSDPNPHPASLQNKSIGES